MRIFKCDDPVDIAVLVPREQLTVSDPMEPAKDRPMFGQDVYFVGFPFGLSMGFSVTPVGMTSPFGYVRKALISAIKMCKD